MRLFVRISFFIVLLFLILPFVNCEQVNELSLESSQLDQQENNTVLEKFQLIASSESNGIYIIEVDTKENSVEFAMVDSLEPNSYSYIERVNSYAYITNAKNSGTISIIDLNSLELLSMPISSGGSFPTHIAASPDKEFMAVANYNGGRVSVYKRNSNGSLELIETVENSGSGPSERQGSSHPHFVNWGPYGEYLYTADLGADRIHRYRTFNDGIEVLSDALVLPSGDGPRQFYFHPNKKFVYILSELTSFLTIAKMNADGTFTSIGRQDLLPSSQVANRGHFTAAHLYITKEGEYLYASNRGNDGVNGDDSMAVFHIESNGLLALVGHVNTLGNHPRFFQVIESAKRVYVSNLRSDNIVEFSMQSNGLLIPTGNIIEIPKIMSIQLLE